MIDLIKKNIKKIIILFILILLIIISIVFYKSNNLNIFSSITNSIYNIFSIPFKEGRKNNNKDILENVRNEVLENEIKELKKVLELNKTLTEYKYINSTVIARNRSYYFNTLKIDKGKNDKIKKDMAVITNEGLVGKIYKLYDNYSIVKLLTSDDLNFKTSILISNNDNDFYAILNGYDKKNKALIVNGIDKNANIEKGNTVYTSGLGNFPKGIYIGKILSIKNDKYNLSKSLLISSDVNFNSIHYVTVLGDKI